MKKVIFALICISFSYSNLLSQSDSTIQELTDKKINEIQSADQVTDFRAIPNFISFEQPQQVLLITDDDTEIISENIRFKFQIPKSNDQLNSFLMTIPLQLLAYHVALLKNCDIDKPRNLAKSVTVE